MTRGILSSLAAGAGLMYFLDPDRGKRRRAITRDKAAREVSRFTNQLDKAFRDFNQRAQGAAAGLRNLISTGSADNDILVARIRAKIGRVVSHPHAIQVTADRGYVTLEGPVLRNEVDDLLSAVKSVCGVKHLHDRLEVHTDAGGIPSLQGGSPRRPRSELAQTNWTPALRVLAGAAGGALVLHSLWGRNSFRVAGSVLGGVLLARATANKDMKSILGLGSGRGAVDIHKTVNIDAPVDEVFAFWSNYQNFPKFMKHLKEVRDLGNSKSHWVAEGPAGVSASWDAEITQKIPNKVLVWRSMPGSRIENTGVVRFDPNHNGGTRVTIRLSYSPPAGMVGHLVASLFGSDPKREMDEDMVRLKSLIELGKTRAHGHMVSREEVLPPSFPNTGAAGA